MQDKIYLNIVRYKRELRFECEFFKFRFRTHVIVCTIYKMSGRSLSVYKDTSASHEYLCTLIKNGHEFCKLLLKRTQIVV